MNFSKIAGSIGFLAGILLVASLLFSPKSQAAEVRVIMAEHCYALLSGKIEKGDAKKVARILNKMPQELRYSSSRIKSAPALCLDSPGGSYVEAVVIMKYLIGQRGSTRTIGYLGTVVDKGMICQAACAIAFLGGAYNEAEDLFNPDRTLHEDGILEFGPPAPDQVDGNASREELQAAYNKSIEAIAELLSTDLTQAPATFIPYKFLSKVLALKSTQWLKVVSGTGLEEMKIKLVKSDGSCWRYSGDSNALKWEYKLKKPC